MAQQQAGEEVYLDLHARKAERGVALNGDHLLIGMHDLRGDGKAHAHAHGAPLCAHTMV
jgi:hypothetical protein